MIRIMPGHLRMVIANNIGLAEFSNFMGRAGSNEKVHLMVSDGSLKSLLVDVLLKMGKVVQDKGVTYQQIFRILKGP